MYALAKVPPADSATRGDAWYWNNEINGAHN